MADDVFFWLCFRRNLKLAQVVWPRCSMPVHVALLGSAICNKVADLAQAQAARRQSEEAARESWRDSNQCRGLQPLPRTPTTAEDSNNCRAKALASRDDAPCAP